jgi:hypothetical protein
VSGELTVRVCVGCISLCQIVSTVFIVYLMSQDILSSSPIAHHPITCAMLNSRPCCHQQPVSYAVLQCVCAECPVCVQGKGGFVATQGSVWMGRKATLRKESGLASAFSGRCHARVYSGSDDLYWRCDVRLAMAI